MADLRPVLVVDFDGTVYRDDAPVRFYARRAAAGLAVEERVRLLDGFEAYLAEGVAAAERFEGGVIAVAPAPPGETARAAAERFDGASAAVLRGSVAPALSPAAVPGDEAVAAVLRGSVAPVLSRAAVPDDEAVAAVLRSAVDAWGAAQRLAALFGVGPAAIEAAFVASREFMLSSECEVEAVPALVDALSELRGEVRIVLATNSPAGGLEPLLDRLGVTGLFDEVLAGAAKPEGLRRWLAGEVASRPAAEVFSLGDHYFNEIEPAVAVGACAGYIDRFGRADGPATVVGSMVEELLPALAEWARDSTRI